MTTDILEFKGEFAYLSNFYRGATFVWDGILWLNSEAAYQAAKSIDRDIRKMFSQMSNPGTAKREGRTVVLRPDWEQVKYSIMWEIVQAKFDQNKDIAGKLMSTGFVHLEEGNNHRDNIWGVCPPGSNNGLNYLGKILMEVRATIRINKLLSE